MSEPRYATPGAFKQALEQRLRNESASGMDLTRRRQLLVFERFLARVQAPRTDSVILKGGLVLELRLHRARTTKDVDLRMVGTPAELLDRLQTAGRMDLGDFMQFEVQPDAHEPEILGEGMRYSGHRFAAECKLAGNLYGRRFGVDIGFGDPIVGDADQVTGSRLLDFAGIPPAQVRLYPIVSHIAEKLHAYSLPRSRPNSRIKDLPDLALLASVGKIEAELLRTALVTTFDFRATHPLPRDLPQAPTHWLEPYAVMAQSDQLIWKSLSSVHEAVRAFLEPLLAVPTMQGVWDPTVWRWS